MEAADSAVKEEEPKTDPVERSILNSIKAAENTVTFEKTEEPKIDPVIERSILSSIKEAAPATEEPIKSDEFKTDSFVEETVINNIEEEDDSVIEEMIIPEFRINPLERSILSSIKESETPKPTEIPVSEVTQEEIENEAPKETAIEIEDQTEQLVEQKIEKTEESNKALIAEDHLEIGKPLDFSFNEKHSFQEWLQLSKTEPIDRSKDDLGESESINNEIDNKNTAPLKVDERQKKAEIIDKFIESNPKISPIKSGNITQAVQIDNNNEDNSYLMTETLARVYLEQKKYTKAIQAYEILILKYPEKITFFADRISDIKILQQNNNNNN
ncbi:tetratricopeptide repeat protein [Flavobacterium hungaricum]|uniref:tetratricopeptide repeat protein n=1 Tax=Flavobacterium hungaricum TaxID=2082725 RepID=UPI003D697DC4